MTNGFDNGVEELNLLEFALGLLATRPPVGKHSLTFEDSIFDQSAGQRIERSVVIASPEEYGLPTQLDQDVLLGAMQLTWRKNRFQNEFVEFSRYELCKLLGYATGGWEYKRLVESLDRWGSTWIKYNNAWRTGDRWKTEGFSVLQSYDVSGGKAAADDEPQNFIWSKKVQKSVASGYVKPLDFDFYLSLKLPTSKRLYRFLDKRFYTRPIYENPNLAEFCRNKLGSAKYPANQYKVKLKPAIEELTACGFLAEQPDSKLFQRESRGVYRVNFKKARKRRASKPVVTKQETPLVQALAERGVTNAKQLFDQGNESIIKQAIVNFDDRNKHGEKLTGGWLRKACESDVPYQFRKEFRTPEQLEEQKKQAAKRQAVKLEGERKREAGERSKAAASKKRIADFMANLASDEERKEFENKAARANSIVRKFYYEHQKEGGETFEMYREVALLKAIEKLDQQQSGGTPNGSEQRRGTRFTSS